VKRSAGSAAIPPAKLLRVIVFMALNLPFRHSVPDLLLRLAHGRRFADKNMRQ
jgi:hypothetical protein